MALKGRYEPPTDEHDAEEALELERATRRGRRKRRRPAPGKVTRTLSMDALWPEVRMLASARARETSDGLPAGAPRTTAPRAAAALQADGGGVADLDPFAVHLIARDGVAGSGGPLPHLETIQRAFGHHDVGGVRAHVGGAAAEAAAEIGAGAYATGDDVAFARAPDLRQAAHEAAHVVQQRGGVRLDGGVGTRGDVYEQHADAVAELVVRGESAEALLDTMAHRGAAGGPAVQRLDDAVAQRALESIQGFAASAAVALDDQLDDSWDDAVRWTTSNVMNELSGYFRRVRETIAGSGDGFEWLLDQAREILQQKYHRESGRSLQTDLETHLEGAERTRALSWITVHNHARPRGTGATGATRSTGSRPPPAAAAEAPVEADALRRRLESLTTTCIRELRAEFAEMTVDDADVLGIIRTYRSGVSSALADHGENVERGLVQQLGVLRRAYADEAHHSLESAIENGLQMGDEATALRLIGVSGGEAPAVRRADGGELAERSAAEAEGAADPAVVEAATRLHDAILAAPASGDERGGDVGDAYRALKQRVEATLHGRGNAEWIRATTRQRFRQITGQSLESTIRSAAGDRTRLVSALLRRCELAADAGGPAVRDGVDPADVVTQLRGRIGPLHDAIERMIAAEGDDKLSSVDDVDRRHEELVSRGRRGGLEAGAARQAVEEAYHAETGHGLVDQLRVATRGHDAARAAVARRLGYELGASSGGTSAAAEPAGDGGEVEGAAGELRHVFERLARRTYAAVSALRNGDLFDASQVDAIDRLLEEADREAETSGLHEQREWMPRFEDAYRHANGVGFRDQLRAACEDDDAQREELERRLGIALGDRSASGGADGSAGGDEADAGALDAALQELHDVFAESWVEDQQVLDAVQAARRAATAAHVAPAAMRERYEGRFHTGLAEQIRTRVVDPAREREALQAIGVVEDRAAEVADELAEGAETPAQAEASRAIVAAASSAAAAMYAGRTRAAVFNEQARAYLEACREPMRASRGRLHGDDLRRILTQQYAALGGDLEADLFAQGDRVAPALRILGWEDLAVRMGRREAEEAGASTDADTPEGAYALAVRAELSRLFAIIDGGYVGAGEQQWFERVDREWDRVLTLRDAPAVAQRRTIAQQLYREVYGLSLGNHLYTRAGNDYARGQLSRRLGFPLEAATADDREVEIRDDLVLREGDGGGFDREAARAAAGELHACLTSGGDMHRLEQIMVSGDGGRGRTAEERRVIRQVYDQAWPSAPLGMQLARTYRGNRGHLRQARSLCGITGDLDARDTIITAAHDRDFHGCREAILQCDASRRAALRDDGEVMAALRAHFSAAQFTSLREILRGDESVDEVAAADGGDADAILESLRTRARIRRRELRAEVVAELGHEPASDAERAEVDRRVRLRLRAWAAEQRADASTIDALLDDFDDDERVEADRALESGGEDDLMAELRADPARATLVADLRSLTDDQRRELAADPEFMSRLRSRVDQPERGRAIAVIEGRAIDGATLEAEGGSLRGVYTSVAEMNEAERRAFAESGGELRDRMDDFESSSSPTSERERYDQMLSDMRGVDASSDPEVRARLALVFHHKYRILGAGSHGAILERALDCHNDESRPDDHRWRQDCQAQVNAALHDQLSMVRGGGEVINITNHLILRAPGAVDEMTRWSLRLHNDDGALEAALGNAPDDHVAREWSNIAKPGERGEMFATVVQAWIRAERDRAGPAWRAFRQFQLDTSADIRQVLRDEWDLGGTTDAEMVAWVNRVRGRIRGLSNEVIAETLGAQGNVSGLTPEDIALLNDGARRAGTERMEDADAVALDRDEGWAARAMTASDERLDRASSRLQQGYNRVLGDHELSADEERELGELREDMTAARDEYRRAREAVAEVAQIVAGTLITVIGAAIAGPGGAGVGMSIIMGATQAAVAGAIQEAVNGRNYEFVRETLPAMVTSAIREGVMAGAGEWLSEAAAAFRPTGELAERAAQWQQVVRRFSTRAYGLPGAAWSAVTDTATDVATDMVAQVANDVYQHGTARGLDVSGAWSDVNLTRELLINLGTNLVTHHVSGAHAQDVREFLRDGSSGGRHDAPPAAGDDTPPPADHDTPPPAAGDDTPPPDHDTPPPAHGGGTGGTGGTGGGGRDGDGHDGDGHDGDGRDGDGDGDGGDGHGHGGGGPDAGGHADPDAPPGRVYVASDPAELAHYRSTYPDVAAHPDDMPVFRYADSTGIEGNGITYWQTEAPHPDYTGPVVIRSTVGELRRSGEVRVDSHAPAATGESLVVIHNPGVTTVPGRARRILGRMGAQGHGDPVFEGDTPEGMWRDFDGNVRDGDEVVTRARRGGPDDDDDGGEGGDGEGGGGEGGPEGAGGAPVASGPIMPDVPPREPDAASAGGGGGGDGERSGGDDGGGSRRRPPPADPELERLIGRIRDRTHDRPLTEHRRDLTTLRETRERRIATLREGIDTHTTWERRLRERGVLISDRVAAVRELREHFGLSREDARAIVHAPIQAWRDERHSLEADLRRIDWEVREVDREIDPHDAWLRLAFADEFGIRSYDTLVAHSIAGQREAHHLVERRFAETMGQGVGEMPSVLLTVEEHQRFTRAWADRIPVGRTPPPTRAEILAAARDIYHDYPVILRALGL